jgi:thymidylate kinase
MNKIKNGFFVVFEGIDGLGKSVQTKLCTERFSKHYDTVSCREPSEQSKKILFGGGAAERNDPDEIFGVYLKDHIELQNSFIKNALKDEKLIFQDRMLIYSHDCYWGEKNAHHIQIHDEVHGQCIKPNLTILFVGDPLLAIKRIKQRKNVNDKGKPWSNILSLKRIQERYLDLASKNSDTFVVMEIDETMCEGEVNNYVSDIIKHKIKRYLEND